MQSVGFDKNVTNAVKGVALIFMLILHFFCFPSWYIDGIDMGIGWMEKYQGHFQICIAIFAFLTGYMYFFAKRKTIGYSLKKIFETVIPYWCALIVLLAVAFATGSADFSATEVLLEFLTLEHKIIPFGWYVTFYIVAMFALPLLVYMFKKYDYIIFALSLILPMGAYYVGAKIGLPNILLSILEKFQVYFPIVTIGYLSASRKVFEKLDCLISNKFVRLALNAVLLVLVFTEPTWLYGLPFNGAFLLFARKLIRIVSIMLFMWSIIEIFKQLPSAVVKCIGFVGKYSLMMWFVHSIFFNHSKNIFQPILFFTRISPIVFLWGLLLTLLISIPLTFISKKLTSIRFRKKNTEPDSSVSSNI